MHFSEPFHSEEKGARGLAFACIGCGIELRASSCACAYRSLIGRTLRCKTLSRLRTGRYSRPLLFHRNGSSWTAREMKIKTENTYWVLLRHSAPAAWFICPGYTRDAQVQSRRTSDSRWAEFDESPAGLRYTREGGMQSTFLCHRQRGGDGGIVMASPCSLLQRGQFRH